MSLLIGILLTIIATITNSVGALFLKLGSKKVSFNIRELIKNKKLILGYFCYGLSALIFIPALKFGDLNVLYPIVSLSYVWVLFLSKKYLKENITIYNWIGILLIMLGVVFIIR